ncbi:MAG TPA: glycoside hydrolase family 2 TIM barrel-domain containing protein [Terriglobia bacterium]|nr:glycoside hydrolase family 2 TIM barrel-domain containing protein [Terriglobia bacterium]
MTSFPVWIFRRVLWGLLLFATFAVPQASAQISSLDGDWHFGIDPAGQLKVADLANIAGPLTARVPGSWQSEFPDLRNYAGVAWYWRAFTVPALAPGRAALIRFGAVDYRAEVYVNGQKAGEHEGGYLPFEIDATPWLRAGENQLAVRVLDPGAKPSEVEGVRYAEIPHGKQSWYVQTSGLWQSVNFEVRPATRIGTLHIRAGADGQFKIDLGIVNPSAAPAADGAGSLSRAPSSPAGPIYAGAQIRDSSGKVVWKEAHDLALGQDRISFSARLPDPQLWSPSAPALYTLDAWLYSGDAASTRFGFRTFEARDGRFYLNGQPIYLRGALDQDFYPETVYTPPSLDFIRQEMEEAKALGLNLLRCHIKVPDPRYLEAADAAGMLIWYEIPNWDKLTPDSERRGLETLEGMVARDANHPSIVAVSLINESWGVDLKQAADREWLKQFAVRARQLVPGWLVNDNSACCDNFHMATDIADTHDYASIPDAAEDFDRFVTDLASRPPSLWSPEGDSQVNPGAPIMLSEFGNWGLPHLPDVLPWWFERDFGGREITRPAGLADRFLQYGFGRIFPSLQALTDATEEHEYQSLKYEIESLRSHGEIQGYVITEFTDVNWESNGLLDMWRHPKAFGPKLASLQGDDLVAPRIAKRNFRSGEHVHVNLFFSHFGSQPLAGAALHWALEGFPTTYIIPLPAAGPDFLMPAVGLDFVVPPVTAPERRTLSFSVEAGGKVLTGNSLDLFFYPPRPEELRPAVSFDDLGGRLRRLAEAMRAHGYLEPSGQESLPVLIASSLDARAQSTLEKGGRVILIGSESQTLAPGLKITARAGTNLDGNWISNFLWVCRGNAVFRAIGFGDLPGFETQAATPPAVIEGLPASAFPDVLAGEFYGWLHSNFGVLLQARAGKGKLLVTTFGLGAAYGNDPYATTLLDNLVQYAVSDFDPRFELSLAPPSR